MHPVDKWRTLVARILTGNHSHAQRLDGAGLGPTETGRDFRERSLHRVGRPVGQVRRRDGAGKRMAWKADRAILSHLPRDAPEAAGVCRHMIEYPVINSHYRSADGGDSVRVSSQG
jgi:hypothetical protein